MKNFKKTIALVLCLILSLGTFANAEEAVLISAPVVKDYEGHWAQATIQKWLDAGKVSGYTDGSYKPDSNVTRAEFVKMVNGIIDFNKKAVITYKDVPASEWFYDYIGVAQAVGYISGYSLDKFGPNDYITREQAASILSRIQYLDNNESAIAKFIDNSNVSAWAKGGVGAASNAGFISGYPDGSLKPLNNLTRAEALTMIDNVLVNGKNYVVYNAGTTLKDSVVEGDLIIAKTVGKGEVSLTNLGVRGKIRIFGGQVTLSGKYREVIASGDSDLFLDDGDIESLTVEKPIVLRGKGKIKTLYANSDGIMYEKDVEIEKIILGPGVTEGPELEAPPIGGGGGGGTGPIGPVINKINIAAITGVTAPVRDAAPVTTITETEQYTGTVVWSPEVVGNKFAASTVYTATITLTAKPGYTLTGVAGNFFTLAGATATNSADTGIVSAVFPARDPVVSIRLKSPDSTEKVFNTAVYESTTEFSIFLYTQVRLIIENPINSTYLNTYISSMNDRLSAIKINGIPLYSDEGYTKAVNYFKGTTIQDDIESLRADILDDDKLTLTDINSILDLYNLIALEDKSKIITNFENFDSNEIKYYDSDISYALSNKVTNSILIKDIVEFTINELLYSDSTVEEFFNRYGTIEFNVNYNSKEAYIIIEKGSVIH